MKKFVEEFVEQFSIFSKNIIKKFQNRKQELNQHQKTLVQKERRQRKPVIHFSRQDDYNKETHHVLNEQKNTIKNNNNLVSKPTRITLPNNQEDVKKNNQYVNKDYCEKESYQDTEPQGKIINRHFQETKQQKVKKQQQKQEPKNPKFDKPKPPLTSYCRFQKQHIDRIKKQQPKLSFGDLQCVIGMMWGNLSPQQKRPYQQAYQQDKTRYDALMIQYYKKNPQQKSKKTKKQKK